MRKFLAKANLFLIGLALVLSFSCKLDLLPEPEEKGTYLTISLAQDSRTILPEIKIENLTDFVLKDSESKVLGNWKNTTELEKAKIAIQVTNSIEYFTLTAKAGGINLSATSSAVLKTGENTLSFNLAISSLGTGNGNVDITLTIPSTNVTESTTCILVNYNNSSHNYTGTAAEPKIGETETTINFTAENIPAGVYKIYIQAAMDDSTYAAYSDLVYVVANQTTTGNVTCSAFIEQALPTLVTFTFKDGDTVLSKEQFAARIGENIYFGAVSAGYSYTSGNIYYQNGRYFIISYNIPTKEGSVFNGWYLDKELTTNAYLYNNNFELTGDMTFYAKWSTPLTVSFNTGFDAITIDSIKVSENSEIYASCNSTYFYLYVNGSDSYRNATNAGYILEGWYTDEACTSENKVDYSNKITVTKDITLYAKWIPSVTIKFNTQGGSFVSDVVCSLNDIIYFSTSETGFTIWKESSAYGNGYSLPTKTGYTFVGWYTDEACTAGNKVNYNNKLTVTEDITLYAKWGTPVKVTFYTSEEDYFEYTEQTILTGYDFGFYYNNTNYKIYVNGGTNWNDVNFPAKEGYKFGGWYTDSEYSEDSFVTYNNPLNVTEDVTFYAKWIAEGATATITFNTNGGSGTLNSKTINAGDNIYIVYYPDNFYLYVNGNSNSFNNPTKEGFVLAGWYTDSECTEKNKVTSDRIFISKDTTLYAKWADAIAINFNTNGGSEITSYNVKENDEVNFSMTETGFYLFVNENSKRYSKPTKEGYTFAGWYTDSDCTADNKITDNNKQRITSAVTYYAKWETPVTVTFNISEEGGKAVSNLILYAGQKLYFYRGTTWFSPYVTDCNCDSRYPCQSGYRIEGIYSDPDYTTRVESTSEAITIQEDTVIYVKLMPNG